ncbi:MAG: phosphate transport system regulatory protein PhoU [Gammaproteobacteria bacterium]|nr:MAG: phosphate transport system regulatory protein PhoU [Gammaproteobacteria bacterium]
MKPTDLPPHISRQYDKELEDVRERVLLMGGLLESLLDRTIEVLDSGDRELAVQVAESDYQVNAYEVSIDEECTEILARRQPAASDLRLVLAISKTITDLERIGDELEKIGRILIKQIDADTPRSRYVGLRTMAARVRDLLHETLDAFTRMDSHRALELIKEDEKIDEEQDSILRQLITYMMEDPRTITSTLDIILAVRALERIGDHAINICEYVVYLVEGKDIRHITLEQARREIEERG